MPSCSCAPLLVPHLAKYTTQVGGQATHHTNLAMTSHSPAPHGRFSDLRYCSAALHACPEPLTTTTTSSVAEDLASPGPWEKVLFYLFLPLVLIGTLIVR